MLIILIAVYLLVTFFLTIIGIEKQNEGFKIFLISLVFTPIIGLFYLYGERRKATRISFYHCDDCDYIYPVKMSNCPICMEQGKKVRLKKYHSPYKVTGLIQPATFA